MLPLHIDLAQRAQGAGALDGADAGVAAGAGGAEIAHRFIADRFQQVQSTQGPQLVGQIAQHDADQTLGLHSPLFGQRLRLTGLPQS
ncbi:MAG: hypothetical protein KDI56_17505, partial [Xanthomonadales bacterium]|nr:hypothetical protein [Xanthomonadales bacterium]